MKIFHGMNLTSTILVSAVVSGYPELKLHVHHVLRNVFVQLATPVSGLHFTLVAGSWYMYVAGVHSGKTF